jgi:hypothetical protein
METQNHFTSSSASNNQYDKIEYKTDDALNCSSGQSSSSPLPDTWSYEHLVDKIFNDLMDCQGAENDIKINKYILQAVEKFRYIRIKSPDVKFSIYAKDFKEDTKKDIELYVKDCKSEEQASRKLDGPISEVIAQIYKEAQPFILSTIKYEDIVWVKKSINGIRSSVSKNWEVVH